MYLTKEEFLVLSARKMGIHCKRDIAEKFKLSETTVTICDNNLFKKYGIKANSTVEAKQKLVEIANLKKVEVVEADKISYFEYENNTLVKKMKITKKDIEALSKYFEKVNDKNQEYELILDEDFNNMYRILKIKDPLTGKKEELMSEIY